jgi:hypothetical protein
VASAVENIRAADGGWTGAIDTGDFGAHIGQHHAAEGAGAYAGEFDDLNSFEWAHC